MRQLVGLATIKRELLYKIIIILGMRAKTAKAVNITSTI